MSKGNSWTHDVSTARKKLKIKGLQVIKKGSKLYNEVKRIHEWTKKWEQVKRLGESVNTGGRLRKKKNKNGGGIGVGGGFKVSGELRTEGQINSKSTSYQYPIQAFM